MIVNCSVLGSIIDPNPVFGARCVKFRVLYGPGDTCWNTVARIRDIPQVTSWVISVEKIKSILLDTSVDIPNPYKDVEKANLSVQMVGPFGDTVSFKNRRLVAPVNHKELIYGHRRRSIQDDEAIIGVLAGSTAIDKCRE